MNDSSSELPAAFFFFLLLFAGPLALCALWAYWKEKKKSSDTLEV